MAEVDVHDSVRCGLAQGDWVAMERLADEEALVAVADMSLIIDLADDIGVVVGDRREGLWERPGTEAVSACRHVEIEGVVRALAVVDVAPVLEAALGLVEVLEQAQRSTSALRLGLKHSFLPWVWGW